MEEKLLRSYKRDEIVYKQTCISLNSPRKEQAFINVTRKEVNAHHWMVTQNKVGHNHNLDKIDRVRFQTCPLDCDSTCIVPYLLQILNVCHMAMPL